MSPQIEEATSSFHFFFNSSLNWRTTNWTEVHRRCDNAENAQNFALQMEINGGKCKRKFTKTFDKNFSYAKSVARSVCVNSLALCVWENVCVCETECASVCPKWTNALALPLSASRALSILWYVFSAHTSFYLFSTSNQIFQTVCECMCEASNWLRWKTKSKVSWR